LDPEREGRAVIESRCILSGSPAAVLARGLRPDRDLGHGLVWTLFGGFEAGRRDFLYRVESLRPFAAIVRSARPPQPSYLWTIERSYPFRPVLEDGQELAFRVACVPTVHVRRSEPTTERAQRRGTTRQDVILSAWRRLPDAARNDPEWLASSADAAALAWLDRQGAQRGFALQANGMAPAVDVVAYERQRLPRSGRRSVVFGSVTFEGLLRVTDATRFRETLHSGIGAARAFGFGLVQIARPPVAGR
jgi:CRISPR system Cascade subunit CasE